MNQKLARLAERRRQLVAQAAVQRTALGRDLEPWRERLARVDQGVAAFRYITRNPAMMLGAAALLLVVLRPRRAGKWLQRGWLLWQVGRRLRKS